jgi:hypothetical protein
MRVIRSYPSCTWRPRPGCGWAGASSVVDTPPCAATRQCRVSASWGSRPRAAEKIELVRAQGTAVYLLGAPGGQAAVLAASAGIETDPWASLGNSLDRAGDELLAATEEYEQAVELIWEASTGQ